MIVWRTLLIVGLLAVASSCAPARPPSGSADVGARPVAQKRITAAVRSNPPTVNSTVGGVANGKVPGVAEIESLVHSGMVVLDNQGQRRAALSEALPDTTNGLWRVFPDGQMETV